MANDAAGYLMVLARAFRQISADGAMRANAIDGTLADHLATEPPESLTALIAVAVRANTEMFGEIFRTLALTKSPVTVFASLVTAMVLAHHHDTVWRPQHPMANTTAFRADAEMSHIGFKDVPPISLRHALISFVPAIAHSSSVPTLSFIFSVLSIDPSEFSTFLQHEAHNVLSTGDGPLTGPLADMLADPTATHSRSFIRENRVYLSSGQQPRSESGGVVNVPKLIAFMQSL
ncbi:hypothetical protein BC828DRAFT_405096 [Blastocladiella britannica]|nr:hypothetical protein BC828DRAFT_405096 [Blastocladiella britannica]